MNPIDYGNRAPGALWRRHWRKLRAIGLILLPLTVYVCLYVVLAKRGFMVGLFSVQYPGAIRFYALDGRSAASLGSSDEKYERFRDEGRVMHLLDDSIYSSDPGWHRQLWRAFYPLERLELVMRGGTVVPIAYPAPVGGALVTGGLSRDGSPHSAPLTGLVYHEWFLRGGTLYRFIAAEHDARLASNELLRERDVYLFEWDVAKPFSAQARPAKRVRRVDAYTRIEWDQRWLVDEDHCIIWREGNGLMNLQMFGDAQRASSTIASLSRVRPVRCNRLSPPSFNRSGRLFAAEQKNALFIFRSNTLQAMRELKPTSALQRFFAARPEELNNTNSKCFLSDDGKLLTRIVTIYRPKAESSRQNETIAVLYDIDADSTRDIPLNIGLRTDVNDVERIGDTTWFYITSTDGRNWSHRLVDETLRNVVHVPADPFQLDSVQLGWDPVARQMVEVPGHPANAQPMDLDMQILMVSIPSGKTSRGLIRYADKSGYPGLCTPGVMKLNPFEETTRAPTTGSSP